MRVWHMLMTMGYCAAIVTGCSPQPPQAQPDDRQPAPAAAPPAAAKPAAAPLRLLNHLEADGNGFYDDAERALLVAELQQRSPRLKDVVFDSDGDGKVSILEQSKGRDPLPLLVDREALLRDGRIPWTIDLFPEWIMSGHVQDDVAVGAVAQQPVRGILSNFQAVQADATRQPAKSGPRSGVEFAADSGQHLNLDGVRDARWNFRWTVFAFRLDGASGSGDTTTLLDINQGNGPYQSSPKITFRKGQGLQLQYIGGGADNGRDYRRLSAPGVVADGKTWNVLVCGIRQGNVFAALNGSELEADKPQPGRFSAPMVYDTKSIIGQKEKTNAGWAYDLLCMGQTEISEATVRKLSGWAAHRLGCQGLLPESHPCRQLRPILDEEDFPHRYLHDDARWAEWGASLKPKENVLTHAGQPRVEPQGFERVFYDDFRKYRIGLSTSGEGDLWMGFGFNTAVGMAAPLLEPGKKPDAYPYDAENRRQAIAIVKQSHNRWRGSAIYSVNDLGQGYTWEGPKVFRIRCMFPKTAPKDLNKGLFPAFWSYGTEWLFWRTSNRIECDWFEFEGADGSWFNGISTHYHYPHVKTDFVRNKDSYPRYKVYRTQMTEANTKVPGGIFLWDGNFHTWEFVVGRDTTTINVTIPEANGERWIELARCPTAPTYLERLALLLDYALKPDRGGPANREDFTIAAIEVLQTTEQVQALPQPFAARPVLNGQPVAGQVLTCQPNTNGIKDIRYYWFADGYPLTYGAANTLTLTPELAGARIRCLVKAVGARDMPEAWSDPVAIAPPAAN